MPNARRWPWWRAAPRATPGTSRRSGCGPGSWPRCCASTTRSAAIRKTWTRSSGWPSGLLEPGAADDRGAERLVRQTRFLAAAFRELEARQAAAGADEHALRARLVAVGRRRVRIVTSSWRSAIGRAIRYGLWPADWDVLARLPGLERLDVVVTDATLAGDLHERLHHLLPGIDEVRAEPATPPRAEPLLVRCRRAARWCTWRATAKRRWPASRAA